MAIWKIYGFKYVTYTDIQFVNAWYIEIIFNSSRKKFLFSLGIRNCIILWYHNFSSRWENLNHENQKMDQIYQITIH